MYRGICTFCGTCRDDMKNLTLLTTFLLLYFVLSDLHKCREEYDKPAVLGSRNHNEPRAALSWMIFRVRQVVYY